MPANVTQSAPGQCTPRPRPTASSVADQFVHQFYAVMGNYPKYLHRFYEDSSMLTINETLESGEVNVETACSQDEIKKKVESFFPDAKVIPDAWCPQFSLEEGILLLVTGTLQRKGKPDCDFSQSFYLAVQKRGYFVLNDIIRIMPLNRLKKSSAAETQTTPRTPPETQPAQAAQQAASKRRDPSPPTNRHSNQEAKLMANATAAAAAAASSDTNSSTSPRSQPRTPANKDAHNRATNGGGNVPSHGHYHHRGLAVAPGHTSRSGPTSPAPNSSSLPPAGQQRRIHSARPRTNPPHDAHTAPLSARSSRISPRMISPRMHQQHHHHQQRQQQQHLQQQHPPHHPPPPPFPMMAMTGHPGDGANGAQRASSVFVRGIPETADERTLMDAFGRYGQVLEGGVTIKQGKRDKFAFVDFANIESVDEVLANEVRVLGKHVRVEEKRPMVINRGAGRGVRRNYSGHSFSMSGSPPGYMTMGGGPRGFHQHAIPQHPTYAGQI